jgi:hypothetical protein
LIKKKTFLAKKKKKSKEGRNFNSGTLKVPHYFVLPETRERKRERETVDVVAFFLLFFAATTRSSSKSQTLLFPVFFSSSSHRREKSTPSGEKM